MRIPRLLAYAFSSIAVLGFASLSAADANTISLSTTYNSYSSPTDPDHPDFYIVPLTFTLPVGFTNASLNISTLHMDDRGVVQLNGTTVTSSGITNGKGLHGQMVFSKDGAAEAYTFEHDYFDTVFAPITSGFKAGLNIIDLIVNDTSGGLNFRQGLLSGGYFWYTTRCFDSSGCPFTEVRDGITYFRGNPNPATGVQFLGTVSYDIGVSPVPVPAALPLLASGLGALGFVGWRRNRKSGVSA